ncbi:hypothetical protein WJX81_002801 [Elliptochloris bilobata]|uniref:Uncharacterized protein n=1 Tax=Elliptochloris bilobata TaxID=381761 RepID=A0AAW1S303_9CHLO
MIIKATRTSVHDNWHRKARTFQRVFTPLRGRMHIAWWPARRTNRSSAACGSRGEHVAVLAGQGNCASHHQAAALRDGLRAVPVQQVGKASHAEALEAVWGACTRRASSAGAAGAIEASGAGAAARGGGAAASTWAAGVLADPRVQALKAGAALQRLPISPMIPAMRGRTSIRFGFACEGGTGEPGAALVGGSSCGAASEGAKGGGDAAGAPAQRPASGTGGKGCAGAKHKLASRRQKPKVK